MGKVAREGKLGGGRWLRQERRGWRDTVYSMDSLHSMWGNLHLNEEEEDAIVINDNACSEVLRKGDRNLIGKIWTDRQVGKNVVESMLAKIWLRSKPIVLREVGRNTFILIFATYADKYRVEGGRPWFFDGQLFVINTFDGSILVSELKFDRASFWVQFHNLPLLGMNKECGEKLGSTIEEVEEVEVDEDDVGWGRSLRVKIPLDLKKPLARGRTIFLHGIKVWIPVKYEKIPSFCFTCGRIIHENVRCQLEKDSST
ncbi:uncharacterized protein LOC122282243 [Carya illinoinensis]|uniref:uncharacterized protein LOC122282243 n=1 Tax=Carya illinoinensis TaxID=32201 RepID=UPI001C7231A8|nr:uncharacterized protein LOC122282243 [Carya illinoinensis]